MLIDTLKNDIKSAMKSGDILKRDLLRYILGECQNKKGDYLNDKEIFSIIRTVVKDQQNIIEQNIAADETLVRMKKENEILSEYLPKELTRDEIEAIILNSDGPEFEQIRDETNFGKAMGIAMSFLKKEGKDVDGKLVKEIVTRIRQDD